MGDHIEVWEKAVRKLRARAMPPADRRRPDERGYELMLSYLESKLDGVAASNPAPSNNVGRISMCRL